MKNISKTLWIITENSDKYRSFSRYNPLRDLDYLDIFRRDERIGKYWEPDRVYFYLDEDDKEINKPLSDFIRYTVLAVNEKAKSILEPIISHTVEFLSLDINAGQYFALHVDRIGCLNVSKSIVKRFSNTGRIMRVEKYAFNWDMIEGIHMFRIPELGISRLFVSDVFKQVVEENDLRGLIFEPVPLVDED